jgi:Transmembrane exosortase (Exosortase_EpsH)
MSIAQPGPVGWLDRLHQSISLREFSGLVLVAVVVNFILALTDVDTRPELIARINEQSIFFWFAMAVTFWRLSKAQDNSPLSFLQLVFGVFLLVLLLISGVVGDTYMLGIPLTLLGLMIFRSGTLDSNLRISGALMLAMSSFLFWGPTFFRIFTPALLSADSALVAGVLSLLRSDFVWDDTVMTIGKDHSIVLVGACSSVMGISVGLLAGVAAIAAVRTKLYRQDFFSLLAIMFLMVALNVGRIVILAWSKELYAYWHDGGGLPIFANVQNFLVIASSFVAAKWVRSPAP